MDLRQYARILRRHWVLVSLTIAVCTGAAGALAWSQPPAYAAQTQLFVSTTGAPASLSQTYQGGLFSQQRVLSYAQLVSSPAVVEGALKQLHLPDSVEHIQAEISASVPVGAVLINVTVTDRSPQRAQQIANVVGSQFSSFVRKLETPPGGNSPVTIAVTRRAQLPTAPVSPKKPLYLLLGALLGIVLGIGFTVIREAFDTRIRDEGEVEAITGASVIGSIARDPRVRRRPLVVIDDPSSMQAEAYRRLRTNLSTVGADPRRRAFVVSSSVASEGKTLVVANLGITLAQAGHRVILVDADLRRPRLAELLGVPSGVGVTDVLVGDVSVEAALRVWREDLPLEVLPSGRQSANPSELLGSQLFEVVLEALTDRADVVILDAPALRPVTDAAVLARLTSGVILVTRMGSTRVEELEGAIRSLRAVDEEVLGVVLTGGRSVRADSRRDDSGYPRGERHRVDAGRVDTGTAVSVATGGDRERFPDWDER
jgi:non-specific protein-tyrosine kinase